jgi:hypothetical protein
MHLGGSSVVGDRRGMLDISDLLAASRGAGSAAQRGGGRGRQPEAGGVTLWGGRGQEDSDEEAAIMEAIARSLREEEAAGGHVGVQWGLSQNEEGIEEEMAHIASSRGWLARFFIF